MTSFDRLYELVALFQLDRLSTEEFAELEAMLADSPEARATFHRCCRMDALMLREAESLDDVSEERARPSTLKNAIWGWVGMAAACAALLAVLIGSMMARPAIVADLVSAENASWESSLSTQPGAELAAGYLKLTSGLATIRFRSGAMVMLEAPAHLVLEDPMRGKLLAGSAVIDVPEEAIGFIIDTPEGYAVDHGTKFAVSVDAAEKHSSFEVLEGEISVHHPKSGGEARLTDKQMTSVTSEGLTTALRSGSEKKVKWKHRGKRTRISTKGRGTSLVRNDERAAWLHPDFLMVKNSKKLDSEYDRRALFGFNLAEVDFDAVRTAQLRLNLVPSGIGFASHLAETNRFLIYGLPDGDAENWSMDCSWSDAATPEEAILLGSFDVPRSHQQGSFGIWNEALLAHLKADSNGQVSFLLVRETPEEEGGGLVHAFASGSHPEASGPALVLYDEIGR